jgi:hypothetical protein
LTLACELGFNVIKLKIELDINMKLDRLETHDRYKVFTDKTSEQAKTIGECVQDLVNQRPFGNVPFYIFTHARTEDDGVSKRLIHQPRLTRPKSQSNSMLFKVRPGSDIVKIIWMIPAIEMWGQYKKGNVTESEIVAWSIQQFETNRGALDAKDTDDLSDKEIDSIYTTLRQQAQHDKHMAKLYLGQ